ncbi:aspartate kinase [Roseivirga sp.]|uniref:aspartate kinase n=1 Tax=Roseivirga sp. TaxID=1964215 RepID=UPI003B8B0D2D
MKVFKFGGASVKDAYSVRNMSAIVKAHLDAPLLVLASAMGKTTNAFERLLALTMEEKDHSSALKEIEDYHLNIIAELGLASNEVLTSDINNIFEQLKNALNEFSSSMGYDYIYDQTVSLGEVLSTKILSSFMNQEGIPTTWLDARKVVKTDSLYRQAQVDWGASQAMIKSQVNQYIETGVVLSQGFIGSDSDFKTTTLGREGSDFSAAIFGTSLGADSVTIWKDVPGVLNADPKKFDNTLLYERLPYKEAAEMTYYGASVIHPKTIKPLAQKNIPLHVKSFQAPSENGTIIEECIVPNLAPAIIHKDKQTVISFKISDFSFINEHHIHLIFEHIKRLNLVINLMQNSATSFTICLDDNPKKREQLRTALMEEFLIYYNEGLEIITVKNYDQDTITELMEGKEIIIEQRSRNNFQMVYKN